VAALISDDKVSQSEGARKACFSCRASVEFHR
jgi:hypothetical protein